MIPTSLACLNLSKFSKIKIVSDVVWKVSGSFGTSEGSSKTSMGGWSTIGQNTTEFFIFNEAYDDDGGAINFFEDLDEFIEL